MQVSINDGCHNYLLNYLKKIDSQLSPLFTTKNLQYTFYRESWWQEVFPEFYYLGIFQHYIYHRALFKQLVATYLMSKTFKYTLKQIFPKDFSKFLYKR